MALIGGRFAWIHIATLPWEGDISTPPQPELAMGCLPVNITSFASEHYLVAVPVSVQPDDVHVRLVASHHAHLL